MRNCRFAVAVHILALLAIMKGKPQTSDFIASSVNTNPVVVRRLVSALAKAGLVASTRGAAGGATLALPAEGITMLEIQRAVAEDEGPALHHQQPNQGCPVGKNVQPVLTRVLGEADAARDAVLARTSLAEVVAEIMA